MAKPARLRLFRTTAFKLSAIYLAVFTLFAGFLIVYIAGRTTELLQQQMRDAVDAELSGLSAQYMIGGVGRLARVIELRSRQPGASLYLVTDFTGQKIAGNVDSVPPSVLNQPSNDPQIVPYARINETEPGARHSALVRVFTIPGGFRLLVGRDVSDTEVLAGVVRRALILTMGLMIVLGLASWLFVSRRVLNRIDSIAATTEGIVGGDLSGRLEVTGNGDEFDRLAESLNAMLTRIERLLLGLKEVSDNIAHDLKTPLTRMRNRVESALSREPSADDREVLRAVIEDADQLIKTFNALLMIARVEAGSSDAEFEPIDAAEVARDVFDLYEPLAEDAGAEIVLEAAEPVMIAGNRELISQALANLVDNALKHAGTETRSPALTIAVTARPDAVVLAVADNGPGIDAADRGRVRERFVRLEASRSKPGAGLGLSLVSAVARLHKGELVLSDNEPGLRAELVLPAGGGGIAA